MSYVYAHGSGTPESPYEIWTADDLDGVRDHLTAHFIQKVNIDLSGFDPWVPIADGLYLSSAYRFKGHYDGGNYSINNLKCGDGVYQRETQGLFGNIESATLENIHIKGVEMDVHFYAGALVGSIPYISSGDPTVIKNCSAEDGFIESNGAAGGLIGDVEDERAIIQNCWADINVRAREETSFSYSEFGGFVGQFAGAKIEYCYSLGDVELIDPSFEVSDVGGFAGSTRGGSFKRCYSKGNVNVPIHENEWMFFIGGFIGEIDPYLSSQFRECFCTGDVLGGWDVGGFVGHCDLGSSYNSFIRDCYSRSNITAVNYAGGFIGEAVRRTYPYSIINCYHAGELDFIGEPDESGGFIADIYNRGSAEPISFLNCYFDFTLSGYTDSYATSKITSEMIYPYDDISSIYENWGFISPPDKLTVIDKFIEKMRGVSCGDTYSDWQFYNNRYYTFDTGWETDGWEFEYYLVSVDKNGNDFRIDFVDDRHILHHWVIPKIGLHIYNNRVYICFHTWFHDGSQTSWQDGDRIWTMSFDLDGGNFTEQQRINEESVSGPSLLDEENGKIYHLYTKKNAVWDVYLGVWDLSNDTYTEHTIPGLPHSGFQSYYSGVNKLFNNQIYNIREVRIGSYDQIIISKFNLDGSGYSEQQITSGDIHHKQPIINIYGDTIYYLYRKGSNLIVATTDLDFQNHQELNSFSIPNYFSIVYPTEIVIFNNILYCYGGFLSTFQYDLEEDVGIFAEQWEYATHDEDSFVTNRNFGYSPEGQLYYSYYYMDPQDDWSEGVTISIGHMVWEHDHLYDKNDGYPYLAWQIKPAGKVIKFLFKVPKLI